MAIVNNSTEKIHPATHVPFITPHSEGPVVNFINLKTGTREWAKILKDEGYPQSTYIELVTKFISVSVDPYLELLKEIWEEA